MKTFKLTLCYCLLACFISRLFIPFKMHNYLNNETIYCNVNLAYEITKGIKPRIFIIFDRKLNLNTFNLINSK